MLTVNTLHITLQYPRNNEWPVLSVLKVTDPQTSAKWAQTKLQLPANWQEELLKLAINPKSYGAILGAALFHSDLKSLIDAALTTSATTRLLLVVEPSELKSLHWERLHFPDTTNVWQSFAQNQKLVFSYYSPSSVKRYYPYLLQRDLKVLFFICSPIKDAALGSRSFTAFDTQAIASALAPNLAGVPHKILYQATDTSWSQLQAELNTQAYTLVHIISHGLYVKGNEQSYLILLDEQQRIRAVSAEEFVNKLQVIAGLPHLLFFSSCNTADPTALSSAHGNFAQIVRNKLATPAVVAMADAVTQATANIVSTEFYGYLYKNAFADLALAKAGHKLLETYDFEQRRDRYLPVLYQDLGNGALFGFEPKGLKDLDAKEINDGLTRLEQTLMQRAPKAVEEFEALAKQAQLGEDLEQLEQFCHEVTDISFATLAQNEAEKVLAAYNEECPFPGMRPFKLDLSQQVDYRKYFFGRDALIEQLCAKLNDPQRAVLAIVGPSGSGKSSLAFAGILTKLGSCS
ncbi:MAG TPA: CHAT domain-containing protein [Thiolinea sp.]|nr:CHAT domain-containing protein [Thiolinea sp.]